MPSLSGKVAVITGGCGGIGQAICARFAREGARVFAADLSQGSAPLPEGVTFQALDVTDEASVAGLGAAVEAKTGKLDILVNAAGIEIEKTVEETGLADWNRVFAVNVTGTFLVSKVGLPLLRKAGGGSIVNFGSYDGFIADPGLAAYCATKGAVHALTRAMACDHSPQGIRVNAVCPGFIDTPMLQSFFRGAGNIESLKQQVRDIHPMRRYGRTTSPAWPPGWPATRRSMPAGSSGCSMAA